MAVRSLAILHAVCARYPTVHYTEFYNDALKDYYMDANKVRSLCDLEPFLAYIKTLLLFSQ